MFKSFHKKNKNLLKIFYIFEFVVVIILLISGLATGVIKENHGIIALISITLILFNLIMIFKLNQINLKTELDYVKNELRIKDGYIETTQRNLLDSMKNLPEAIVIFNESDIVFVNEAFKEFVNGISSKEFDFLDLDEMHQKLVANFREITKGKKKHFVEAKVSNANGEDIDINVYVSKLMLDGEICNYVIVQNVSAESKELRRAAHFQKNRMLKNIPQIDGLKFENIYVPYYVVSGDFYYLYSNKKGELIGILGDVMGKGISAALYNSAMDILFKEAVKKTEQPSEILSYLNKEVCKYFDENLVATICFKIDLNNNKIYISNAGINEFIYVNSKGDISKKSNKGFFLGMFEDAEFTDYTAELKSEDEYYFYTDGLEQLFSETDFVASLASINGLAGKTEYIRRTLPIPRESRKDDCTLLAYKIK